MTTIQNFANTLLVGDVLHWDDELLAVVEVANYAPLGVTEGAVRVVVVPADGADLVNDVRRTLWLEEDDAVQYDRATDDDEPYDMSNAAVAERYQQRADALWAKPVMSARDVAAAQAYRDRAFELRRVR